MTEEQAKEIVSAAKKRIQDKKKELPAVDANESKSVQKRMKKQADKPLTEKDKVELKLKEQKEKLKQAQAKNDNKAIEKAQKEINDAKKKLEKMAKEEAKKARQEQDKAKKNENKKQGKGLKEIDGEMKDKKKKYEKVSEEIEKNPQNKKKKKEKDQEKGKNNEHTMTDQKAKLASRINVDGLDIQQHGPKFVLVGKNGRETDVTDVMNQVDKYNKGVDAQNAAVKAQGAVQSGIADKAKEMKPAGQGLPVNGSNGNVQIKGSPELLPSIPAPQQKAGEDIVASKLPELKPDEKAFVAQTALQLSKLDLMKDPKAMEKLNERKKENDEKEQQKMRAMQSQRQTGNTH